MKNSQRTSYIIASRAALSFRAPAYTRRARSHPLSPIGLIDGGEGWGEGAARTLTDAHRNAPRFPLTQPSPPSKLRGEGLRLRAGLGVVGDYSSSDALRMPR